MFEASINLKAKSHELIGHTQICLVVCAHGNSRSKQVARILAEMGYQKVRVMGIRDGMLTRSQKKEMLQNADVVLTTSSGVEGDVRRFLRIEQLDVSQLRSVTLTEADHHALYSITKGAFTGDPAAINSRIKQQLAAVGFF